MAGQGTLGMELARQSPDLDAVFVCVGRGGLIGGVGAAIKTLSPQTRIVGVWTGASTCIPDSLAAGAFVATPQRGTLSQASTRAAGTGSGTVPGCRGGNDGVRTLGLIDM